MSNLRHHKIEAIKSWINTLTADNTYNQDLLGAYNGDELEKMTTKQLDMLLNYIRAVYHHAFHAGAEMMRESRKGA